MATAVAAKQLFVFNGFHDIRATFDGKIWNFPYGETRPLTEYLSTAPDEYARNHESNPDENAMLEKVYSPQELAEVLFGSNGENLLGEGCVVVAETDITAQQKEVARERGRIMKARIASELLADKNARFQKGASAVPLTPTVIGWLKECGIHDPIYYPEADKQSDIEKLAAVIASMQQQSSASQQQQVRK